MTEKKIVICGGGIMGCSTAYHLAKKGYKCTVIDRCGIGCAASGKAGGFLARHWCDGGPVGPLARLSFDMHAQLAQVFTGTDYRRLTTIGATMREGEKLRSKSKGMPEWADGNAKGGSEMGTPEDTAQVHPYKLTSAFMDGAMSLAGSSFRKGVVQSVEIDDGDVSGVKVDGEVVAADVVVIALGPWSSQARRWLQTPQVSGHRAHSITIKPEGEIGAHALFMDHINKDGRHEDPEVYPRPDGEVYLCGMGDDEALPEDPADIRHSQDSCQHLWRIAGEVSSRLGQGQLNATQACYLPMSQDGVPIIGPVPGITGAFIATGHSCWGILNGPATGAIMAELITEGHCKLLDVTPFDPNRFK